MKNKDLPPPPTERILTMARMYYDVAYVYNNQEESIGYSYRFYVQEMVRHSRSRIVKFWPIDPIKLLSVNGIAPSKENIRDGTYPFTVNIYAVTAGTANPHVNNLLDWLLSSQGQELIEKTGYIGIAANRN